MSNYSQHPEELTGKGGEGQSNISTDLKVCREGSHGSKCGSLKITSPADIYIEGAKSK